MYPKIMKYIIIIDTISGVTDKTHAKYAEWSKVYSTRIE